MKISGNDLKRQYDLYAPEYESKALEVLRSGWYILGREVSAFEEEFAEWVGTRYCVSLASGLDALWISMKLSGIGPGDDVIVAANAYIACVMGITINGARPVFVEPDEFFNIDALKIEEALTPQTKAILAVHLFGQCCDMEKLTQIANAHDLILLEDCAQAHGNHWNGKKAGSFGKAGCFSFYPTKGCGAFGDGGAIVTDDPKLAEQVRVYRNYGSEKKYHNQIVGTNSRLDELQAGLLRIKLGHMKEINTERSAIAERYDQGINNDLIHLPKVRPLCDSSWHQYVIRCGQRDALIQWLNKHEIGSMIHYPIPPHLSEAYAYLGYSKGAFPITEKYANEVLSLPMFNGLTTEEQDFVVAVINEFKGGDQ